MQTDHTFAPLTGGCACGRVRFRLDSAPIVVNCCHCRFCQRQSGSAFAVNAMIETDRLTLIGVGAPVPTHIASALPAGQTAYRCPECCLTLWTNHSMLGNAIAIVRIGALDDGERLSPDVHCFIATKHPWMVLPVGVPAFAQGYDPRRVLSGEAKGRLQGAMRGTT